MKTETNISHAHNDIFIDLFNDSLLKNKGIGYDCMNYINNYNLLMNTVDKIEAKEFNFSKSYYDFHILPDAIIVYKQNEEETPLILINLSEGKGSIETEPTLYESKKSALYHAIVIFLKWVYEQEQNALKAPIVEEIEWKCTDPDNNQYGRQLSERVFEFKELNRYGLYNDEGDIIQITINLDHYTPEQTEEHIQAYYQSMEQLKEIYGDSADWIIAECIFEQESGLY